MAGSEDGESAIDAIGTGASRPNPAVLERAIALRLERLEHLVAGLGIVLQRLQEGGQPLEGMTFDDFDDPAASNEALDVLFESSADARRDLSAVRRDLPVLMAATISASRHPARVRFERLAASANVLAERFEEQRRSIDQRVPPRTPGGVARLDEFVVINLRVLREVAATVAELPAITTAVEPSAALAAAAPGAAPSNPIAPPVAARPERVPLGAWLWQHLRRRRTRLMLEGAGVALVAIVILVSALGNGVGPEGFAAATNSPGGFPSSTAPAPVAVGGGSPVPSASPVGSAAAAPSALSSIPPPSSQPGPSVQPGPTSGPPGTPPPHPTPRPTAGPAPTPDDAAAAARFADRLESATSSIDTTLGDITDAVQGAAFEQAAAGARSLATISTDEHTWLIAHPPAACFQDSYASALTRYTALLDTASSIEQSAAAEDGNAIHQQVGSAHNDVAGLRQAASKAVASCA